jgi:hypothetical protein
MEFHAVSMPSRPAAHLAIGYDWLRTSATLTTASGVVLIHEVDLTRQVLDALTRGA